MDDIIMERCDLVSNEYYIGSFGDKRLMQRGIELMHEMCQKLTFNIRKLGGNRQMEVGFHRFLDNDEVTVEEMEKAIASKTHENCKGLKTVVCIDDTSEISFPSQKEKKEEFGKTGNPYGKGFFIHPTLVIDPEKQEVLGLCSINIWSREESDDKDKKRVSQRPIEEKESYKWIDSVIKTNKYITDVPEKVYVSDRESDIYEYIFMVMNGGDKLVVRAAQNRRLEDTQQKLMEHLEKQAIYDSYEISLEKTPKRKARVAKLNIKYVKVEIRRPDEMFNGSNYPESLSVWAIQIEEDKITIPEGAEGVNWVLLTNIELNALQDIQKVIYYYQLRWLIELLFGTSKKKGLDIEASQVSSFEKLKKLTIIGLASTVKVFCLKQAREQQTETKAKHVFSDQEIVFLSVVVKTLEGRTEKQKNPFLSESLSWSSWIISRLGGWKGYKSESPPGIFTIRDGLEKFYNMYAGWSLFNAL